MKRVIAIIIIILVVFSLSACGLSDFELVGVKETEQKRLTKNEAIEELIRTAEPQLAIALEIPSYIFEMDYYDVTYAIHNEDRGYWYFEVEGRVPMDDGNGLWFIRYEFDAEVDDMTGYVTLGKLSLYK